MEENKIKPMNKDKSSRLTGRGTFYLVTGFLLLTISIISTIKEMVTMGVWEFVTFLLSPGTWIGAILLTRVEKNTTDNIRHSKKLLYLGLSILFACGLFLLLALLIPMIRVMKR